MELVFSIADGLQSRVDPETGSKQIIKAIKYQDLAHRKMGTYIQSILESTIDNFKQVYKYAKEYRDSILQAERQIK